jgi:hypothetical protein
MDTTPVRRKRFRLYIDESGDHSANLMDSESHRFLALLGVWFEHNDYIAFADTMETFKRDIFGARPDRPVCLHRSDVINRKGPFFVLRDTKVADKFDERLIRLISEARFTMICVIIDKKKQKERYAAMASPFSLHPYHFCLAAILFRYCRWLLGQEAIGDVMAESRGREEDLQLKNAYKNVYQSGTNSLSHDKYQRALSSKEIKLQSKRACIAGLELADMLAHPVKSIYLHRKGLISEPPGPFGVRIHAAVHDKLLTANGSPENVGWMCF